MKQAKTEPRTEGRAANREARRQQLINATMDSISKRGFSGTTLQTVTTGAKLSHGVVNFYFNSKEELYIETLGYLAQEHYERWHGAMREAETDPVSQLTAIVEADFDRNICSPKKLAVWFAFWGQAKYRPNYLKVHHGHDDERYAEISRLCAEIAADGGYEHIDPEVVARGLEAIIDGLWLSLLMYPKLADRHEARDDAFAYLACAFPKHFSMPDRRSDEGECRLGAKA